VSHKLTSTEAVSVVQNQPLWKLLAICDAIYCSWCKPEMMMLKNVMLINVLLSDLGSKMRVSIIMSL